MAIDVESIIIDALLSLMEDEGVPLARVTVKQIMQASGVSRQTFYNHFLDKNDLVCHIYDKRVIGEFDSGEPTSDRGPGDPHLPGYLPVLLALDVRPYDP
ncbi:MAG: TetR family transcriptional regulator [Atopobiaceae bacterium]|nr:TetR family transcriptional regulator [Atopobiaceae bacterium]